MKIKLDENLPLGLAVVLKSLGHNVHTTAEEGLAGKPDADVWAAAQREERFLITQDLDFPTCADLLLARITEFCWLDFIRQIGGASPIESREFFVTRMSSDGLGVLLSRQNTKYESCGNS
jgi:Domain of unknown function (DUF5615)